MADALSGNPLNSAAAIGVEIEKLRDSVYAQFNQDDVFLTKIGAKNDLKVSERMCRIPLLVQPGSTFGQFVPDGTTDSMGTGGGEVYDNGVTTPAYFVQSCQVTKEAEWSTNANEKSVVDVFKDSFKINLKAFRKNLDGLVSCSSGAGDLTSVAATPPGSVGQNYLSVLNSNVLQAGVTYQIFSAVNGTLRGTILILTSDLANNIVYLVEVNGAYYPTGTVAGDVIIVSGAPGTAVTTYNPDRYSTGQVSSSLNGIPAINVNATTGDWFGIPRSTYPGVLNAEYVNGASTALSPQMILNLQSLVQRANGADAEELDEFIVHCNVDQVTAWESLGIVGVSATAGTSNAAGAQAYTIQEGGDGKRMDYLKRDRIKTLAGHELITNINAIRNRVDLLSLKHWFRIEVKPAALYDVDGVTAFPLYGSDGGVAPTTAFYFVTGMNVAGDKPRSGGYIDTLAIPAGL